MTYKHRQTFILTPNDEDSQEIIREAKKRIVEECGVEPKILQNMTMICLEWEKEGVIL